LSLWNSIHNHDLNKIIIQQEEPISLQWIELYKTVAMASILTLSTTCASTLPTSANEDNANEELMNAYFGCGCFWHV
jgi:hypothetical protein